MIAKFISSRDIDISNANERFKKGLEIYNKIKDLDCIEYLQSLVEQPIELDSSIWSMPHITIKNSRVNLDKVCSVIGELELDLDADDTSVSSSESNKQIQYSIMQEGYTILKVFVYDPICEWVETDKEIHHYEASTETIIHHKIVCS